AVPQSQAGFAYRGQIDQAVPASSGWTVARESVGPLQAPSAKRPHLLQIESWVVAGQFRVRWTYNTGMHRRTTIEALAERFLPDLQALIAHCLTPEARGYTPSDFPLADLDQRTLDQLALLIEDGREEGLD